MNKILVTGVNGQLGYDVVKELNKRGYGAIGVDRERMDLTNSNEIKECINNINPDGIIHCAAYTAVDAAEENVELCEKVNAFAVRDIATCASDMDIPMIYISTDYIFDGSKGNDLLNKEIAVTTVKDDISIHSEVYVEEDEACPINVYGRTKYEGEKYVKNILDKYYIVRISWVFGENGNNFIDTMLRLSKDRDKLNVINDQVGSPTYTKDLARLLVDMIGTDKYGVYNATNEGYCSWYDFAKKIFDISGVDIDVSPISASEYTTKAARPMNSRMSKQKLIDNGFEVLRSWEDAVEEYIKN